MKPKNLKVQHIGQWQPRVASQSSQSVFHGLKDVIMDGVPCAPVYCTAILITLLFFDAWFYYTVKTLTLRPLHAQNVLLLLKNGVYQQMLVLNTEVPSFPWKLSFLTKPIPVWILWHLTMFLVCLAMNEQLTSLGTRTEKWPFIINS